MVPTRQQSVNIIPPAADVYKVSSSIIMGSEDNICSAVANNLPQPKDVCIVAEMPHEEEINEVEKKPEEDIYAANKSLDSNIGFYEFKMCDGKEIKNDSYLNEEEDINIIKNKSMINIKNDDDYENRAEKFYKAWWILPAYMFLVLNCGSIFWGWAGGFREMFMKMGAYNWIIDEARRETMVGYLLTTASLSNLVSDGIVGNILDYCGPRYTLLFGISIRYIGWAIIAISSHTLPLYILGMVFIGASTDLIYFPFCSYGTIFDTKRGFVVSLLGASMSFSSFVPILIFQIWDKLFTHWSPPAYLGTYSTIWMVTMIIATIFLFPIKGFKETISSNIQFMNNTHNIKHTKNTPNIKSSTNNFPTFKENHTDSSQPLLQSGRTHEEGTLCQHINPEPTLSFRTNTPSYTSGNSSTGGLSDPFIKGVHTSLDKPINDSFSSETITRGEGTTIPLFNKFSNLIHPISSQEKERTSKVFKRCTKTDNWNVHTDSYLFMNNEEVTCNNLEKRKMNLEPKNVSLEDSPHKTTSCCECTFNYSREEEGGGILRDVVCSNESNESKKISFSCEKKVENRLSLTTYSNASNNNNNNNNNNIRGNNRVCLRGGNNMFWWCTYTSFINVLTSIKEWFKPIIRPSFLLIIPIGCFLIVRSEYVQRNSYRDIPLTYDLWVIISPLRFFPCAIMGYISDKFGHINTLLLFEILAAILFISNFFQGLFADIISTFSMFIFTSWIMTSQYVYISKTQPSNEFGRLCGTIAVVSGAFLFINVLIAPYTEEYKGRFIVGVCMLCLSFVNMFVLLSTHFINYNINWSYANTQED